MSSQTEQVAQLLRPAKAPACYYTHPECGTCRRHGQVNDVECKACTGYGWLLCAECRAMIDQYGEQLDELNAGGYSSQERRDGLLLAMVKS